MLARGGPVAGPARGLSGPPARRDRAGAGLANPTGGRTQNYTGDLATLFSCMAELGTDGCGLEMHLESMRVALDSSNVYNAGFLRPDAYLGIVIVGDEDDCSTRDMTLFSQNDPSKGQINFRCTEYGITSDLDADPLHMQQFGDRTAYAPRPREDSRYLYPVQGYVDFVKGPKKDPRSIIVAHIGGPVTPVDIEGDIYETLGHPARDPRVVPLGGRSQAVRVPRRPQARVRERVPVIGDPCIEGTLVDTNPDEADVQPDGSVVEVVDPGAAHPAQTILPECTPEGAGAHAATPCWYLYEDAASGGFTPSHLKIAADRGGASAPPDTHLQVQCVVQ